MSDPLRWLGVAEIAAGFRTAAFTPRDYLREALRRIDALDPLLNSFLYVDRAGASAAADVATCEIAAGRALGPLHGVPIGIKDLVDVAGMPTTCHSKIMPRTPVATDAAVVARLRAAGAIILGKLATHEFAIGGPAFDLPFPPARNPWNLDHHPGGSSSGAGAAVAAGLVPLAIGTDTAGSIRNPAGACGIVGLKPTLHAVPTTGVFPLSWSLDTVGPLARSVADAALLFEAIADRRLAATPLGVHGLTIGYVRHFHETDMPADAETTAALDHVAATLAALGATVRDVTLPPLALFAAVNRVIFQSEGFAVHAEAFRTRPQDFSSLTRAALLPGAFTPAELYLTAQRRRSELIVAVEAAFADVDVLLCASSMEPACRIDDPDEIARTYMRNARAPFSVTGHPALAMLAGLSSGGLPLSVQFAARYRDEATLLRVAAAWEAAAGKTGAGKPRRPPFNL